MAITAHAHSRRSQERAGWPVRARRAVRVPALLLLGCAVGMLLGWLFDVEPFVTGGPGQAVTSPLTALGVACLALGVLAPPGGVVRRTCYAVPLFIGVVACGQYALGWEGGAADFLAASGAAGDAVQDAGRPSIASSGALVALSAGALLNESGRRTAAQVLHGAGLLVALSALYGYMYGVDDLYRVGDAATVSATSATGLLGAAVCLWLVVPSGVLQWIVFGHDSGARSQRGLIPVAVLLIPAAAWWYVEALNEEVVSVATGTGLMTSFTALVIVVVNYRTGRTAFLIDREREQLLEELHQVNAELEDRVRTKVHQLNRQRTKLALFEERDRIARDLHDRVIQRIFAAGLQAASLGRLARKDAARRGEEPMIAESLDLVAIELDLAIRELRNSIFELTSLGDLDDLEQVVHDIAARAARILGFMPRVSVSGPVAGLPADLVAQLASVLQEGLSNVARHARASMVEVTVTGTEEEIEVRVSDDGVGLPDPLPRSSGVSNLMNRARQLGGTATWGNGTPKGTVLTWRVPRGSQVQRLDEPVAGAITRGPLAAGNPDQGNDTPVADSDLVHSAAAASTS